MTPDEARALLFMHAGAESQPSAKAESGFLGMLRPYHGLREENFHEVMACLRALEGPLQSKALDREIVRALWSLCHFARVWGVEEDGLLRRNKIISDEDSRRLDGWINTISYAVFCLLEGTPGEAFAVYERRYRRGSVTT